MPEGRSFQTSGSKSVSKFFLAVFSSLKLRPSKKSDMWAGFAVFGYRHIEVLSQEVPYGGGGVAGNVTSLPREGEEAKPRPS